MTERLDAISQETARRLHADHMSMLGIADTMSLAHAWNLRRFGRQDALRRRLYEGRLADLLRENGGTTRPVLEMKDGWALDRSMSLPHLDALLELSDEIFAHRAGQRTSGPGAYRSFFQDVWHPATDPVDYPAFLDFATSSDLVATVADYLGCIPALSTTLPSGIRLVESNRLFDDRPDVPHDSQLYHIDYYSLPNVYVLVLLQDTTSEHGPWTFLPRSISQRVAEALGYWRYGRGYRLTDEEVYSLADRSEAIEFTGARGSVLFIESSGCLHFGSRSSVRPRFQAMLGYTGAARTDFTEDFMDPKVYPVRDGDSDLRRLLLQKNHLFPELEVSSSDGLAH
jgi:hypothetical protein